MKNKLIALLGGASMLALTGCGEEFLEVEPSQFLTQEQVQEAAENNPDVVAGSMSGIYTLMFQTGTGGDGGHDDFGQKGYDIFSDFLTSDLALSISTYGWYRTVTEYQATTDFTFGENYMVWRYYYRIVRSANLVIDALGGNDAVPELDENLHIMGQAKAMRAYAYFYLTQFMQRDYNPSEEILPIYIVPDSPNVGKSTAQEVFDLIVSDLTDAIDHLETFQRGAKNEVNQNVAKALLAYTYAAMGDYAQTKTITAEIINSGEFALVNKTEATGGFNDVATPGWMWGADLTNDIGLNLVSWWGQMDAYTYSYQWAGDRKVMDQSLFDLIPANDVRKGQFLDNSASAYHLAPINKFYDPNRVIGGQRYITTDYVYMRVAEMYLLHAEASAATGDDASARQSLKALLVERLENPGDENYVDALSGQALMDEIYLQTRIELWGEGKTYLALKRTDNTTFRGDNHLSSVGETLESDDPKLTFMIPQSEIQNNPFIDSQNN
ncbi:RagB/SusD family nutrient uptake outer membrane protein [Roseivirga pacifica]|uniref:RagB/SusD family nutrient uptake outer membrane protein n=1 Tax=Roseivirga pacifica TaxID=1267423 RepID=UPI00209515FB|nr:RagB/SusD family nutrient uptake outer membrane protein [Roseivirga pacifica]MCO6358656.1 RagB/SusD family nutrient uptake outer membrane protein [Roseivirga pacifica]MCO6365708.1 RagB/SusD family nutrient uptake outer membrane protein [Roseivirga pacifica]MCO6371562.1 RagB/SusD family nutrient uptake outer membrane protein [Roseivirga pacifica]MCO6376327.1 RagB/SusD family nutrient uptake outer membrane protein [Roseivirga pacifica]MCO6378940.1 RagB/SusD family nutrient uptake outer membra